MGGASIDTGPLRFHEPRQVMTIAWHDGPPGDVERAAHGSRSDRPAASRRNRYRSPASGASLVRSVGWSSTSRPGTHRRGAPAGHPARPNDLSAGRPGCPVQHVKIPAIRHTNGGHHGRRGARLAGTGALVGP
jgi:hypothetical protein